MYGECCGYEFPFRYSGLRLYCKRTVLLPPDLWMLTMYDNDVLVIVLTICHRRILLILVIIIDYLWRPIS